MSEQSFGIANPYFLDSSEARRRVVVGDADELKASTIPKLSNSKVTIEESSQPKKPWATPVGIMGISQGNQSQDSEEPWATPVQSYQPVMKSLEQIESPSKIKEEQGFIPGMYYALKEGAQKTLNSVRATGGVLLGSNEDVITAAEESTNLEKNSKAQALKDLKGEFKRIGEDPRKEGMSALRQVPFYASEVTNALWDNLTGASQFITEQTPNMAVALAPAIAGAKVGAGVGTVVAPVGGTLIGGTLGFIAGLFGGNALLEVGGKAQEFAADKVFTEEERQKSIKEGATKAAVITAVDAVTLGASKWILGTSSRAVESATKQALKGAGIDAEKAALNIKNAQDDVLRASQGLDDSVARANFEKATIDAATKEGLFQPSVAKAVQEAQKKAYEASSTFGQRIFRGSGIAGLETIGEGVGEYLGELAATGKSDVLNAVIEGLAGAAMSSTEVYAANKLTKPGTLTNATAGLPESEQKGDTKAEPKGTVTLGNINDIRASSVNVASTAKAKAGPDFLAAMYLEADDAGKIVINKVAERTGVLNELRSALDNEEAIQRGNLIVADDRGFAKNFMDAANIFVNNPPQQGKFKRPSNNKTLADVEKENEQLFSDPNYLASLAAEEERIRQETENNKRSNTTSQAQNMSQQTPTTPFIDGGRVIKIENVNGVQIPFYISTGLGGKASVETGKWYPFFGMGKESGWFNKGSEEDINNFYGVPELKRVADRLNSTIGDIRKQMDDGSLPFAWDGKSNIPAWKKDRSVVVNYGNDLSPVEFGESVANNINNVLNKIKRNLNEEVESVGTPVDINQAINLTRNNMSEQERRQLNDENQRRKDQESLGNEIPFEGNIDAETAIKNTLNNMSEAERRSLNDQKNQALNDLKDALIDLESFIATKSGTKINMLPQDEQNLMPILIKLFDSAAKLGYVSLKEATNFVIESIRSKFGDNVSDQISDDLLKKSYDANIRNVNTQSRERNARLAKLKEEAASASINTPLAREVIGSGDGNRSRLENTTEQAEKGNDEALKNAEDFIASVKNLNEAQKEVDRLTAERQKPENNTPEMQSQLDSANEKYRVANNLYQESQARLEGKTFERFPQKTSNVLATDPNLTIAEVTKRREDALNKIKDKIKAGKFFDAEMEWQQYSNTKELINGRIALNSVRIADGEVAIVEELSKTEPDMKLFDKYQKAVDALKEDNKKLNKSLKDSKNEFANFINQYVQDNPTSNLRSAVFKYLNHNSKIQKKDRTFLGIYHDVDMYRKAINTILTRALKSNTELTVDSLRDRPESIYEKLNNKQVGFLNALLDQTKLSDVKTFFNEYKANQELKKQKSSLSDDGEKFKTKLNNIINALYEPDTYKNLILELRNRQQIISNVLNNKSEPGDMGIFSSAQVFTNMDGEATTFDPSIAQEIRSTPRDALLRMIRDLESDIREAMDSRIESIAKRYSLAQDLIASNLFNAKSEAIESGVPMDEVSALYDEAFRSFIVGIGYNANEKMVSDGGGLRFAPTLSQLFNGKPPTWATTTSEQEIPTQVQAIIQESLPTDPKSSLQGLILDIKSGKVNQQAAIKEIQTSIQDGDFNFDTVKEAFNKEKLDLPAEFYPAFSHIALNYSLDYWVKKNGGGYAVKDQWLTSYHSARLRLENESGYQDVLKLEPEEEAEYRSWLKDVNDALARRRDQSNLSLRSNQDEMQSDAIDNAFLAPLDKFLFKKYSLNEIRNIDSLPEKDQVLLKKIGVDRLVKEWHRDLKYALDKYPDLAERILSFDLNSDAIVKGDEAVEHAQWMQEINRRVEESIRRNKSTSQSSDLISLYEMGGISAQEYDQFYLALSTADMNEATAILENANNLAKLNLGGKNTGTIFEDEVNRLEKEDNLRSSYVEDLISDMELESYQNTAGVAGFRRDFASQDIVDNTESDPDIDQDLIMDLDNYSDDLGSDRLKVGTYSGVVSAANVGVWVNELTKDWISPNIQVFANPRHLPEPIRSRVLEKISQLSNGMGAKGFFDSSNGNIYLFSDYLTSKTDTEFTLFHEAYGHLGMRGFLGNKLDSFLTSTYKTNSTVRELVDIRMSEQGIGLLEAVEEVLADTNTLDRAPSAVKTYLGKVIFGLRQIGMTKVAEWLAGFSNAEMSYVLQASKNWAKNPDYQAFNGAPADIRLNEVYLPYEMFSLKGGKMHAYARFNPITNEWYVFSNSKNDIRSNYTTTIYSNFENVLETMQKFGKVERRRRSPLYQDDKIGSDFVDIVTDTNVSDLKRKGLNLWQGLQNEYLPVFRLVNALGKQGRFGVFDITQALMTYDSKAGNLLANFDRDYVGPIMDLLKEARKNGASTEAINNFLIAQTAEERNTQVKKINPKIPFGSGMGPRTRTKKDGTVIVGYLDVLEEVNNSPYRDQLYAIGNLLDKMSLAKVAYEINTGLISVKDGAARNAAYLHYRNLSGVNVTLTDSKGNPITLDEDMSSVPNVGYKFNAKGTDKRAMGRGDLAPDVLARTLVGFESSIIRGQKNIIAQKVLAMLETNYDPNFASINEQSYVQKVGADGLVQLVEDPNYISRKDVMVAKMNGIPVTIRFKQIGKGSVGEALHGMVYPPEANSILNGLGSYNRLIGQMLTTWNIAWVPVNFVRDIQTMFNNAAVNGKLGKGAARAMFKALPSAMHVVIYDSFAKIRTTTPQGAMAKKGIMAFLNVKKPNRAMYQAYLEAKKEGGLTSFINNKDLDQQIIRINDAINGVHGPKWVLSKTQGVLDLLEFITLPLEMAPRIAAYKIAKDSRYGGMKTPDAAVFAKEITVNFNMKGSYKGLRQWFLFFNPAVQGTAGMVKLAYNNKGKFGLLAGSWIAFGMVMNMLGRALSGDDEDGVNKIDKLPIYKRATSIVIRADQRGEAIPLPYGWNALYAIGHFAMDSLKYGVPYDVTAKRILTTVFEAFSPVGGSIADSSDPLKALAKTAVPTAGLPLVEYMVNENRFGAPIYKDADRGASDADSDTKKAFRSVSPISQAFVNSLQEMTGGSRIDKLGIDINPALIDHFIGGYLPGTINEIYKGASTAARKAKGLDVGREKEPIIDRFSAYAPEMRDADTFRRVSKEMKGVIEQLKILNPDSERAKELNKEYPGVRSAWEGIKIADANIRNVGSQLNKLETSIDAIEINKTLDGAELEAEKARLVRAQNEARANLKKLYSSATQRFIQAGFKDRVVSGN